MEKKLKTGTYFRVCMVVFILMLCFRFTDKNAAAATINSIRNSDNSLCYYTLSVNQNHLFIEGMTEEEVSEYYYAFYNPENNEYITDAMMGNVNNHRFSQELLLPLKDAVPQDGIYQLYLNLKDAKCSPCIVVTNGQIRLFQPEYYERNVLSDTFLHRLDKKTLLETNRLHQYDSSRSDLSMTKSQRSELFTFAQNLTAGLTSDYDKAKAIYRFVAENIYYDVAAFRNSNGNNNPYWVFRNQHSVCEGYVRLTVELLNQLDIPSAVIIGDAGTAPVSDNMGSSHAWIAIYADDRWFYADPTWDSHNLYEEEAFHYEPSTLQYFDVTLEVLAATHCNEYVEGSIEKGDFNITFYDGELTVDTYQGTKSLIQLPDKLDNMQITQVTGYFIEKFNYKVKGIVVPEGYQTLYSSAFQRYPALEYILLPDTIEEIGDNSFYNSEEVVTICNANNRIVHDYAQENEITLIKQKLNLINVKEKNNISDAVISSISNVTYAGTELRPEPVVTYRDKVLQRDVDYTLTYKNNDKAGSGYVSVLGMGDYDGVKVRTFSILPKKVSFQLRKLTKNSARAYWKESPGATGYEILYSFTEKGSYQSIGYHQSLDCIIERLETGYTYYFKIRPYVYIGEKVYYGGYSKVVSIKM